MAGFCFAFPQGDMDGVPRPLADFGPDVLADADDIADGTILIFHTHVQDATAVRYTIKADINLNSSFAKFLANICL